MVLCTKDQEDTRPGLMVILFAFHFSRKWLDTLHQIWERSVLYGLGLSSENEFCFLKIWLTLSTQGRVGRSYLGRQVEFRICKQTNKIYRNSTQPLIKKYTWWTPERLVCYQPQPSLLPVTTLAWVFVSSMLIKYHKGKHLSNLYFLKDSSVDLKCDMVLESHHNPESRT